MLGQHGTLHFTVCILEYRNRLSTFWFFVFLVGFSFSCLNCPFVPIWANQKRARTSITCILSSSSSSYRKGGRGGRRPEQPVLIFGHLGNIGELFPSLASRFPLFQPCCCVFTPTIPNPPCSFPRQRTPTHALPRPRVPFPPPFIRPCQTRSRTRRDEGGYGKGGIFIRVVREGRGVDGGRGVRGWECVGKEKENPLLPLGTKPSAEIFNVGMGGRGGGGRRLLAWTGRKGLLAWIRSQGKKFAMLTCDEQEVSAQLGCLSFSLSAYLRRGWGTGQPRPGSSKGKKKRRDTTTPNIITPTERGRHRPPSVKRLETRRLLVQSLLFISQRHNHTDISFNSPSPHHHTCRPLHSTVPSPGGRLA